MHLKLPLASLLVVLLAPACAAAPTADTSASSADELRPLTKREALEELAMLGDALRANYAPLEFKKTRLGFDLEGSLAQARLKIESATTEGGRIRPLYELLAGLKDGNVSLRYTVRADESAEHRIPFAVTTFGGAYVVEASSWSPLANARGDKLLAIDGMTTAELEDRLAPIAAMSTPETTRFSVAALMTGRPFYAPTELLPTAGTATVLLERPDGTTYTVEAPWKTTRGGVAGQVVAAAPPPVAGGVPAPLAEGISDRLAFVIDRAAAIAADAPPAAPVTPAPSTVARGLSTPWFLTSEVRQQLGVVEVEPRTDTLTRFQVTVPAGDSVAPDTTRFVGLRAYKYAFAGKTILLVRIPRFATLRRNDAANVGWLSALLADNVAAPRGDGTNAAPTSVADTPADVVVLDVTHNAGGSTPYALGLASLFTKAPIPSQVQASRADRLLIAGLVAQANSVDAATQPIFLERLRAAETAYDIGNLLTPFTPIAGPLRGPGVTVTFAESAGSNMIEPSSLVTWDRPVLVLQDELTGSTAEAFPLLLKKAGVAKTFGARTAGQGGAVANVVALPYSGGSLALTRSLFGAYDPTAPVELIENVGVAPDFPHQSSVADFRSGFVGYATAFSTVATTLTR